MALLYPCTPSAGCIFSGPCMHSASGIILRRVRVQQGRTLFACAYLRQARLSPMVERQHLALRSTPRRTAPHRTPRDDAAKACMHVRQAALFCPCALSEHHTPSHPLHTTWHWPHAWTALQFTTCHTCVARRLSEGRGSACPTMRNVQTPTNPPPCSSEKATPHACWTCMQARTPCKNQPPAAGVHGIGACIACMRASNCWADCALHDTVQVAQAASVHPAMLAELD